MALAAQYHTWRTTTNPDCLSKDAALHYVTTLVTHTGAPAVLKHVSAQAQVLRKKQEEVLTSTESLTALCEEIHTVIEFTNAGGAYLPGLDANLVVDHTITLPIVHVVQFDTDGRIEQIRLHWDQGALLKGLGVIGMRGANWPITESEHQAKLIKESVANTADALEPKRKDGLEETTKNMGGVSITSRTTQKLNPTNDPHTSLDFAAMNTNPTAAAMAGSPAKGGAGRNYAPNRLFDVEEDVKSTPQSVVAPRGTSKPQERDWGELFVGGDDSNNPTPKAGDQGSPSKGRVAAKIGAGKNYARNRLFEMQDEDVAAQDSPSKDRTYIKPHATKFQHFDLASGGQDGEESAKPATRTTHTSQWDFADFTAPVKPQRTRGQSQGAHHFAFDDDTKADSPMKKAVPKPRRDADTHFELQDDGGDADYTSASDRQRQVGGHGHGHAQSHNRNQSSLWQSQTDDGGPDAADAKSYTQTSVVSNKDRSNTFGAHWAISDENPGATDASHDASAMHRQTGIGASIKDRTKDFDAHWAIDDEHPGATDDSHDASRSHTGVSSNKAKVLQTLAAQWEARDDSDGGNEIAKAQKQAEGGDGNFPAGKENQPALPRGIRTFGDGSGGRKGTSRQWGFGDDEGDAPPPHVAKGAHRPPGGHSSVAFWERED